MMPIKRMNNRVTALPPADQLLAEAKRIYRYDDVVGGLRWIAHANPAHPGRAFLGQLVGGDDGHGYRMCMLLGHKFKVHQIVWLLHHGSLPTMPMDHANRDKRDNRIANLRLTHDWQNTGNSVNGTGRLTGAAKQHNGWRYYAKIDVQRKRYFLGNFDTPEEANAAYVEASRKLRGEFSPV